MESDLNYQRTNVVDLQNTWLKLLDEEAKLAKFEVINLALRGSRKAII